MFGGAFVPQTYPVMLRRARRTPSLSTKSYLRMIPLIIPSLDHNHLFLQCHLTLGPVVTIMPETTPGFSEAVT